MRSAYAGVERDLNQDAHRAARAAPLGPQRHPLLGEGAGARRELREEAAGGLTHGLRVMHQLLRGRGPVGTGDQRADLAWRAAEHAHLQLHRPRTDAVVRLGVWIGEVRRWIDDYSPLARRMFCPEDEKIVLPDEIIRGFEIAPDQYIPITDEELESVSPERSRTIEIVEFI